MAYASPADFEVMDEPARSSTPPKWANPDQFDVMDEPAEQPRPAAPAPVNPIIANDPFAAFNEKLSTSPLAKMPEVNLPERPAVPDVTRTVQPVKQVTTEDVLPVAKEVPSHGIYANETPTLVSNIREGKFGDAAALAKENVMGSSPMRFLFGPTEKQQIAESVPVKKEDGSTQYEFKPASPDAVEKLGAVGAARRSISSLERGIPVTELDKAVEGEMLKDNPNDSTLQSIGKGLYNAIHRSVVAFSDPTMALIPESRIISGAFTVDMANSAKEQIQKGLEADNPREAVEGLLGGVITLGMAGMSGSHTLKKGETPTKADIIEHMDKVPDELLHEASKELKTSSPDVADAANSELIKRAADFWQELNGVLQRLPGDVQEKVNGILQKQLSGEELTANERATMLQVRSYASRLQQEQTNAEFTGSTAQPEPKPATATPASSNVGVPSGGPRIESVSPVDESQQGRSSAFAQAKAEAAAQPLREAAAAAEESSPLAAQAAKEQADLLEKRAQEQASKAKETSPPPTVEPPAQGQPEPPIAAEERPQADEPTPVTEGAAAKPELGTRIVGPVLQVDGKTYAEGKIGQHHKDIVAEALNNYFKENPYAGDVPRFDHRFKDDKGNVLDREEGYQLAKKANQISPETARSVEALAESSGDKPQLHADHLITEEAVQPKPQFVLPKRAEAAGDQMVTVDIGKFDVGFAKDPQYIGKGKEDVPGRRAGFEAYEKTGKPIETPEVSVSPDGKVTFINGRHRYAVLRDRGEGSMPMAMSEESIANARKNGLLKDETPRETKPVSTESQAQESTVPRSRTPADEIPAPETPTVAKEGSLLDKLESLLTEEEQPKPVEQPPQSAAAKRVADIQRDIENNANAEPAWKRRRQKDLKAAQKALAEEQAGAPTEEVAPEPAPVEKQLWQKTRDEVKAEGGILTKHRVMTRAAVERGEDVPLDVLEDYSGHHWADKARHDKYGEQVSDSLLTRIIDSLKDDKGNLHFDPLFIQSVGKPALRGAVKLIREAIEAGGLAKDVLEDVVAYIKKNAPASDEAKAREFFQPVIDEALGGKEAPVEEAKVRNESPSSTPSEPAPAPEQSTQGQTVTDSRMVDEGGRRLTSTKNEIVDQERQRRGEAPIFSEAEKALGVTWREAMDEFAKNPKAGEDLVTELNKKPRAITAKEDAVLLREKIDVMNDLTKATETALNGKADPADRVEARVRSAVLMDQLNEIDGATRKAGTEWGRTGRFHQMLAAEDYSLSRMMQKKQLALGEKWEKMTDEEKAKVNEQTHEMSERIASLEKQLAEHEANQALEIERVRNEEADKAIQKMASGPETPADAYTRGVLEKIQAGLKSQADKARARIRARLGKASAGVDPTVLYDVAVIGAEKLFSTGLDFARWSSEMLSDVGDSLKHYLTEDTFKKSQEINDRAIEKGAPKSVREKIKPKAPTTDAEKQQNLVNRIAEKRKNGAREAIGGSIQKLAESFVRGGITEREPLIDAVHAAVKEALPEATRKDIRDAISGYGQFKELSKDEAKVILGDLKGQMQQISKIEDMTERGKLPAKTGVQHREPSAEERQLIKEVNKIKKELGLESTDPAQLKSALDAAKTRTRNRIEDLQRAIEKKEKIPKSEKSLKEDDELRDLNARRDALQKEYDAAFGPAKPTEAEIAAEKAQKGVDAAAAALDRWDRIAKGELTPDLKTAKEPSSNLEEELRAQTEAIKQAVRESNRKPTDEQARLIRALEKATEEYRRRAAAGELGGKGKEASRPDTELVAKARAARDAAKKILDDLRKQAKPQRTPEEIALAVYKARTKARIEELNDRTKRGDFSKKERKSVELDPEGVKLKADAERAKLEFDRALYKDRQKNMPMTHRILDYIPKIARASLLSNPITFAKLVMAAVYRLGGTPIEEVVGGGLGHLPFISQVAERAPIQGGFNAKAELKALKDAWMLGLSDAKQKFKTGETDLDVLSGKRSIIPHHWLDFFGNVHGMIKAPVVRAEYARSFEKRTEFYANHGIDVTEPAVLLKIHNEAYQDAQRAIFQQDNKFVQMWNTALRQLEQPSKTTGRVSLGAKAAQSALKTLLPIVKIPTNIVAEGFNHALGTEIGAAKLVGIALRGAMENKKTTGSLKLGKAFEEGVKQLKPEEADMIMRHLKKGSVGKAIMLLGFLASQSVGGFYQPGQRRRDDDVKPGTVRIFGVNIPSWALHNPAVEQLQMGATIARVAYSKLRHRDRDTQGIPAGVMAAALGLVEEVPFLSMASNLHKLFTPGERMDYLGELARSRAEPQFIQWMAQQGDRASYLPPSEVRQRKPEDFTQEMEMGIPGLRQNVPLNRRKRRGL
jgi:hypothetical protein